MSLKIDLKEKGRVLAHFLREYRDLLVAYYELDERVIQEAKDNILKVKGKDEIEPYYPYYLATLCEILCVYLEK